MPDDSTGNAIGYNRKFDLGFHVIGDGLTTEEFGEPAAVNVSRRVSQQALSTLGNKSSPIKVFFILLS